MHKKNHMLLKYGGSCNFNIHMVRLPGASKGSRIWPNYLGLTLQGFRNIQVPGQSLNNPSFHEYLDFLHGWKLGQSVDNGTDGQGFSRRTPRVFALDTFGKIHGSQAVFDFNVL
jgi:hypothetical protein